MRNAAACSGRQPQPCRFGNSWHPQTGAKPAESSSALRAGHQAARCQSPTTQTVSRRVLGWSWLAGITAPLLSGPQPAQAVLIEEDISMRVFDAACQSVVSIINYKAEGGIQVPEGVGTGVVWGGSYVVTNYHVLSKVDKSLLSQATKVVVADPDGAQSTTYSVELAGSDAMHDLAVLRITDPPAKQLPPVRLGRSTELQVGQYVFAIGNSFGLTRTLSAGIVSGLNRSIPSPVGTRIYGAIQTDASINAGNSGGPLLDSSGQMVGLNTATFTRSGTGRGSGVNFALPAQLLLEIVPSLIVYGNAMGKR